MNPAFLLSKFWKFSGGAETFSVSNIRLAQVSAPPQASLKDV